MDKKIMIQVIVILIFFGLAALFFWLGEQFPSAKERLNTAGSIFGVIGIFNLLIFIPTFYCADCGQRIGKLFLPDQCPRCGCNRFTEKDPGVGSTHKHRHL